MSSPPCARLLTLVIIAGCSSSKTPSPSPRVAPHTQQLAANAGSTPLNVPGFTEAFPSGLPHVCRLGSQSLASFIKSPIREQCLCAVKTPADSCGDALEKFEPRSLLDVDFGPQKTTIHHGETVSFHLYISNHRDRDIPLIVTDIPGRQVTIREWPKTPGEHCDYGSNNDWWKYAVSLQPGARLTYEYSWDATHVLWIDSTTDECVDERRPLPVGRYVLFWRSPAILDKGPLGWFVELTVIP